MMTITVRRVGPELIEYEVIEGRTYHANREATFTGPHTDDPASQVHGPAYTLWRANDADMLAAFREKYPDADIML
jgi:hypothetical protein